MDNRAAVVSAIYNDQIIAFINKYMLDFVNSENYTYVVNDKGDMILCQDTQAILDKFNEAKELRMKQIAESFGVPINEITYAICK